MSRMLVVTICSEPLRRHGNPSNVRTKISLEFGFKGLNIKYICMLVVLMLILYHCGPQLLSHKLVLCQTIFSLILIQNTGRVVAWNVLLRPNIPLFTRRSHNCSDFIGQFQNGCHFPWGDRVHWAAWICFKTSGGWWIIFLVGLFNQFQQTFQRFQCKKGIKYALLLCG